MVAAQIAGSDEGISGGAWGAAGDPELVDAYCGRALKLNPPARDVASLWAMRAHVRLCLDEAEGAARAARKAIKTGASCRGDARASAAVADGWRVLAWFSYRSGQPDAAIACAEQLREIPHRLTHEREFDRVFMQTLKAEIAQQRYTMLLAGRVFSV
jgi:hypothetical protein